MVFISKDFFKLQIDFALLWSKKQNIPYDEVLFKNTCLYVRILGYCDVNKPSITNKQWVQILKNKPGNISEQINYFYDLYINFEKSKEPVPPPTACFTYNYHPDKNIFELHFVNADPRGNFLKDRMNIRKAELKKLFEQIKIANHNNALVKVETWMLNAEAFKRLFPNEFTEKAVLLDTGFTQNNTHWGQFLTKEGNLKIESANKFLITVEKENFKHINQYLPRPAKISLLSLPFFYDFYHI